MTQLPADQCITSFLHEADRLGVAVRWEKKMTNLDAAYVAPQAVLVRFFCLTARQGPKTPSSARCWPMKWCM